MLQSDLVRTNRGDANGNELRDIGVNQYLFYNINDCWALGGRMEWWKSNGVVYGDGNSASYQEITGGVNYKPTRQRDCPPGNSLQLDERERRQRHRELQQHGVRHRRDLHVLVTEDGGPRREGRQHATPALDSHTLDPRPISTACPSTGDCPQGSPRFFCAYGIVGAGCDWVAACVYFAPLRGVM